MAQPRQRGVREQAVGGAPAPGRERILVVEDDPDVRELVCDLLKLEGYDPVPVEDGEAAVRVVVDPPAPGGADERAPVNGAARPAAASGANGASPATRAAPVDAVILDVMLPGMNGFAVCQALKFRRETNLIPILMLTALDTVEDRERGLWVGADRYLTKPFEPQTLLGELRDTLDHRRELQAGNVRSVVRLSMQSDGRLREQLNDLLSELFLTSPLSEEELGRIRYAAMEMVANAIEWGNRQRKELRVSISYELTDDMVKFVVADEGAGFNPVAVPHAANDEDPVGHMAIREELGLRDGGFGIMIARGMVDKVEYNDAGNQVTLIKYLKPAAADAGAEVPPGDAPEA